MNQANNAQAMSQPMPRTTPNQSWSRQPETINPNARECLRLVIPRCLTCAINGGRLQDRRATVSASCGLDSVALCWSTNGPQMTQNEAKAMYPTKGRRLLKRPILQGHFT
jgi:hypothetical protein